MGQRLYVSGRQSYISRKATAACFSLSAPPMTFCLFVPVVLLASHPRPLSASLSLLRCSSCSISCCDMCFYWETEARRKVPIRWGPEAWQISREIILSLGETEI